MMLNSAEVAGMLGVTMETVYKLCKRGRIAHYRFGPDGGAIRFKPEDVEAYIVSCRRVVKPRVTINRGA